jgi:kynurenine formamidase
MTSPRCRRWRRAPTPCDRASRPGLHLLENLKLDELAAKRIYEFAFVMQPLKIKGGSGSTVAPVAIR